MQTINNFNIRRLYILYFKTVQQTVNYAFLKLISTTYNFFVEKSGLRKVPFPDEEDGDTTN